MGWRGRVMKGLVNPIKELDLILRETAGALDGLQVGERCNQICLMASEQFTQVSPLPWGKPVPWRGKSEEKGLELHPPLKSTARSNFP